MAQRDLDQEALCTGAIFIMERELRKPHVHRRPANRIADVPLAQRSRMFRMLMPEHPRRVRSW